MMLSNVYCIWYPSGGFGHFINAVLSLYGENFVRPKKYLKFSKTGDSHSLDLIAPKFSRDQDTYNFNFTSTKTYSVLIDNGIHNESDRFVNFFYEAKIIKICYSDLSWPIIAKTMIEKAQRINFSSNIFPESDKWQEFTPWAQREKYFLFLRNHEFRSMWKPSNNCFNLFIDDLFNYTLLIKKLSIFGIKTKNFKNLLYQWQISNKQYIDPVITSQTILNAVAANKSIPLNIQDTWTQAIVYYMIWVKYQFEVPHNDYSNWFTDTQDIVNMLIDHGVSIDT